MFDVLSYPGAPAVTPLGDDSQEELELFAYAGHACPELVAGNQLSSENPFAPGTLALRATAPAFIAMVGFSRLRVSRVVGFCK